MYRTSLARVARPAALFTALLVASCGGGAAAPTTGGLVVRMHDHPIDSADHVYVTIDGVEVVKTAGDGTDVRETVTSVPGQYDLLALRDGVEAVLGGGQFEPGTYHSIRLMVAKDSRQDVRNLPADQLKNYIVIEGVPHPLFVPSGCRRGIVLGRNFTIEAGVTTVLTLDFDVRQSIRTCGRHHRFYVLWPRIRVVPTVTPGGDSGFGDVSGHVSTADNTALPVGATVSAQQDGAEVASGAVDGNGDFAITGLPVGSYDLIVLAPGDTFDSETGVSVTDGATSANHDFSVTNAENGVGTGTIMGTATSSVAQDSVTVRLHWHGFLVATVSADTDTGAYQFDPMPNGEDYTVTATDGTTTSSLDVVALSGFFQADFSL